MNKYNIKELAEKLERCRNVNLDDVKLEEADDITDIKIDRRKPSNERILNFIIKERNPYVFKVNGNTETEVYWYVGKITYELSENSTKASYGKKIIDALSSKLTKEFGSGFSSVSIRRMRRFYEMYPIWSTVSTELSWAHFQELIKKNRK